MQIWWMLKTTQRYKWQKKSMCYYTYIINNQLFPVHKPTAVLDKVKMWNSLYCLFYILLLKYLINNIVTRNRQKFNKFILPKCHTRQISLILVQFCNLHGIPWLVPHLYYILLSWLQIWQSLKGKLKRSRNWKSFTYLFGVRGKMSPTPPAITPLSTIAHLSSPSFPLPLSLVKKKYRASLNTFWLEN